MELIAAVGNKYLKSFQLLLDKVIFSVENDFLRNLDNSPLVHFIGNPAIRHKRAVIKTHYFGLTWVILFLNLQIGMSMTTQHKKAPKLML